MARGDSIAELIEAIYLLKMNRELIDKFWDDIKNKKHVNIDRDRMRNLTEAEKYYVEKIAKLKKELNDS
jgi:hypothetical protein